MKSHKRGGIDDWFECQDVRESNFEEELEKLIIRKDRRKTQDRERYRAKHGKKKVNINTFYDPYQKISGDAEYFRRWG